MNKPNNYENASVEGQYVPVSLGGHYATIKSVEERLTANGKDMIVVFFDFAANDKQPDYFKKQYLADEREGKKWPFAGTSYIMVNDYQDPTKTSTKFKTFCVSAEKSNSGFSVSWGNDWGKQFVGKKIGVVYGEDESEYNGEKRMRPAIRKFCALADVESAPVPKPKYLKAPAVAPAAVDDKSFEELLF